MHQNLFAFHATLVACLLLLIAGIRGDDLESPRLTIDQDAQSKVSSAAKRPNILVLMGDDWSWPHAGVYGDRAARTPTFDRLAKEGVLFSNAFVSSPSCTPSRFSIATGQWIWRLGDGANLGGSLEAKVPVYSEILEAAGYRIGFAKKGGAPSKHLHRNRDPFGDRFNSLEAFLKKQSDDQPFCFWYGAGQPHRPYRAGRGKRSGFDPAAVKVPGCLPDHPIVRSDLCDYLERINRFDDDSARMLSLLKKSGLRDNTIIVVAGDNGMPFPRCKATLYDEGTHVPLIVHWPRQFPGGRTVDDFVSLTDLAPTFLELAGQPKPKVMTGQSLLPILKSERQGRIEPKRSFVLAGMERHVFAQPARSIRTENFLYIRNFDIDNWPKIEEADSYPRIDYAKGEWHAEKSGFPLNIDQSPTLELLFNQKADPKITPFFNLAMGSRAEEELYDIRADPASLHNLAEDPKYLPTKKRLRAKLDDELQKSGDPRMRKPSSRRDPKPEKRPS